MLATNCSSCLSVGELHNKFVYFGLYRIIHSWLYSFSEVRTIYEHRYKWKYISIYLWFHFCFSMYTFFFQTTPCDTNSSIQTCILAAGFNGYQVTKLQRASQTFFLMLQLNCSLIDCIIKKCIVKLQSDILRLQTKYLLAQQWKSF